MAMNIRERKRLDSVCVLKSDLLPIAQHTLNVHATGMEIDVTQRGIGRHNRQFRKPCQHAAKSKL